MKQSTPAQQSKFPNLHRDSKRAISFVYIENRAARASTVSLLSIYCKRRASGENASDDYNTARREREKGVETHDMERERENVGEPASS